MFCPPLTITFLGTGTSTGVPMVACRCAVCSSSDPKDVRLRSSILVRSAQTTLVIDTTPDFRYQMLREKVMELDAVVFTHPHKDHIAGMDDIKAYSFFAGQPMRIYANEMTATALKREFMYVFAEEKYPGIPEVDLQSIGLEPFMVGDIPLIPIRVWHHRMPVLGFRMGAFTYITDANHIDEEEKAKIRGSTVLVLNALRVKEHLSHFNLNEAIATSEDLGSPGTYFTHVSHQLGLHREVESTLPAHIRLAYDGLKLDVPGWENS
jgi:phosphoribosyl 1,2-cyclic phosphate phosphodiesterase